MCTLTLVPAKDHLIITMNRDEAVDRHEGPPHRWLDSDQPRRWFGTDKASGGSWFGVNEFGLAIALLNRYQAHNPDASRSRGELIPSLLPAPDRSAAERRLNAASWSLYAPFDLLLIDQWGISHHQWDGQCARHWEEPPGPALYTSASVASSTATLYRQRVFRRHLASGSPPDADALLELHRTRCPERPALGLLMERPGRHTKSLCQALLGNDSVHTRHLTRKQLLAGTRPAWETAPLADPVCV